MGKLTTHVLDTANGCPAAGMAVRLYHSRDGAATRTQAFTLNDDGRADGAAAGQGEPAPGRYRLVFEVAAPLPRAAWRWPSRPSSTRCRWTSASPTVAAHYHVPLLASPGLFDLPRQLRPGSGKVPIAACRLYTV